MHPAQRALVERSFNGPARVSGSAGTGKTIVALHRAVFLARSDPHARVLLTTFSDGLASALRTKLRRLISNEPRLAERLEVLSLDAAALRLHERIVGPARIAGDTEVDVLLAEAASAGDAGRFSASFLCAEWRDVLDAWQLDSWETYRDVARLGRKTRLPEARRAELWAIFERVRDALRDRGVKTYAGVFGALTARMSDGARPPFEYVVVDEAQHVSVAQLRFLAAMAAGQPNALFFAGDLGQRIFQQPFSWKSLGVDILGRSFTLKINYRTSHEIRGFADKLLAPEITDVDGVIERRSETVSTFNGPAPEVRTFRTQTDEEAAVAAWLRGHVDDGLHLHEFGLFVRSEDQFERARRALAIAGCAGVALDTMHAAKGLEYRAVAVMACDDEVVPLQERIAAVGDPGDLNEVYASERHLLYVACTRARDFLIVTGVEPVSEFLDDLREGVTGLL